MNLSMQLSIAILLAVANVNYVVMSILLRPISFSDMYEQKFACDYDSWTTCNVALGDPLPIDAL